MRECRIIIACGKRGVGKSVETIRMIDEYVAGVPSKGIPPRKALIFDVNDEFSSFWYFGQQRSIKALAIKDIMKFSVHPKIEVRRIRPFWDDGKKLTINDMGEVLGIILDNYRNGLLLVEDINKYLSDAMPADLIGSLATSRHIGLDIVSHFQNIGRAGNPKLLGNLNMIRLHKTNDTVERHKNKFEEKTELLQIAENLVTKKYEEGDVRYFVYVDTENMKIRGKISKSDAEDAIHQYITDRFNRIVSPMLQSRDKKGKKIYTEETALSNANSKLLKTYFTFKEM
jgi:ribosomal protein L30/L7E